MGASPPKDSKVETVPQLKPLWRRLVLDLGTQGSWKALGDDAPPCWVQRSRRGLAEERQAFARLGRLLRESERSGGGGGRLDLRRETLRVTEREDVEEEALCFLFSHFSREAVEIFSEQTELLSVRDGDERAEDNRASAVQPSAEMLRMSWAMAFHSSLICSLWTLELGERER